MIRLSQLASYGWIGVVTALAHYGTLIGLVELAGMAPVPATLAGFVVGAGVSTRSTAGSPSARSAAMAPLAGASW
jgi:hypothetical protein